MIDVEITNDILKYAHPNDAAMDIVFTSVEYNNIYDCYIYGTGIYAQTTGHKCALIFPRSSVYKTDAYLANSVGVVDTDQYTGEWKVIFKNRVDINTIIMREAVRKMLNLPWWNRIFTNFDDIIKSVSDTINPLSLAPYRVGERGAQVIFIDIPQVNIKTVDSIKDTERGDGGFGSTNNIQI